jgi:hypothetical protein
VDAVRAASRVWSSKHSSYYSEKSEAAKDYFLNHEQLKDPSHPYKARDITAALPSGRWQARRPRATPPNTSAVLKPAPILGNRVSSLLSISRLGYKYG